MVAVHGAFRADNYGDTVLLQVTLRWVNRLGYRAALSNCTERTAKQVDGDFEMFLWREHMRRTVALVYTGGGYLGEGPVTSAKWHRSLVKQVLPIGAGFRLARKPYGFLGVGVGPLSYRFSRMAIGWLARGARVSSVRDTESRDYLLAYGGSKERVIVTADLALASELRDMYPCAGQGKNLDKPYALIHLIHKPDTDAHQWATCECIREFLRTTPNARVVSVSDNPAKAHREIACSIGEFMGHDRCSVEAYESPRQLSELISGARFTVTNKLHVGVISAAYGRPTYALANHGKTERFFRQIGRLEHWSPRSTPSLDRLGSFLREAWSGGIGEAPGLGAAREAAEQNRLFLQRMIAGELSVSHPESWENDQCV